MKKKLPIDITKVPQKDLVKYEMAKELGLYDQVIEKGWGSLSARQFCCTHCFLHIPLQTPWHPLFLLSASQ